MRLPFTLDQFLDVFAAFNVATWPFLGALWIASVAGLLLVIRGNSRTAKYVAVLLALHWLWSGVVYHIVYFRRINPAALLFGIAFIVQAALFLWWFARVPGNAFQLRANRWSQFGIALMGYAVLYPALGLALGLAYPRMPLFGVPCPTTLFTIGALLIARDAVPRTFAIIPLAWAIVGGSAAFLFGITTDLVLLLAGVLLLVSTMGAKHRVRIA